MDLITGAAGFIGFHLAKKHLEMGSHLVAVDNLNDYYDVSLKNARLLELKKYPNFTFHKIDISDRNLIPELFSQYNFKRVIHLAAQAGVRYSIANPLEYVDSNILGFTNIIEASRRHNIEHFIYASTSTVYGANTTQPFSVSQSTNHPLAIYPATKKCNELIAHAYSHLHKLPTTGLRFFTVYGPWGRPDMALFLFTKALFNDEPLNVYNYGNMMRDFTYIDDIVECISLVMDKKAEPNPDWDATTPDPSSSNAPYRIYNIGNSQPVPLMEYIRTIEKATEKKAKLNLLPLQAGDAFSTHADTSCFEKEFSYKPKTTVADGVKQFVEWYKQFYHHDLNQVFN